jgi:hypothetical protein
VWSLEDEMKIREMTKEEKEMHMNALKEISTFRGNRFILEEVTPHE